MSAFFLLFLAGVADAGCTAIVGATVHLPSGPAAGATVVLVDDRIAAVGAEIDGLNVSADGAGTFGGQACEVVSADGKQVTAGYIESASQLGLVEVGLEDATRDNDAGGDDPIRAALKVADAYNPRSTLIPIQRIFGVTGALVLPSGGRISGQAAHVSLAGSTQAETVRDDAVAVVAGIGGGSRAEGLRQLRQALRDARDFERGKAAWLRNQYRPLATDPADLEALWPVVRGEIPLVVQANRAADLEALLRLKAEEGIELVIRGAAEGWMLADALAQAGVAVIVDPMVYGPGGFDQIHGAADNPAKLAAAGVPVILATGSSHNARNLGQYAGNAVRGGMAHADALAAISAVPAEVFGLEGRGQIAVGSFADVVLWDGDPLEITSVVDGLWINGRAIELVSRQTRLRDAYIELPGTPVPSLSLPEP